LEEKYEKARNSLKDLEMTYGSKIIDLERDKAVSQEKLQNITNLLESSNSGYSEEVEKL